LGSNLNLCILEHTLIFNKKEDKEESYIVQLFGNIVETKN